MFLFCRNCCMSLLCTVSLCLADPAEWPRGPWIPGPPEIGQEKDYRFHPLLLYSSYTDHEK